MVRGGMAWRPLSLPVLPWPAFSRSGPLESPAGTVAVIAVAEVTVKVALVPLNATALAPVKLVPLMVTLVPTGPLLGVPTRRASDLTTVNEPALVAVPPGVVTLSVPEVAPGGTVARMVVSEVTVKVALVPLNATALAPVKLVPLMVTLVPTGPLVGEKLAIVGGLTTVNEQTLVAEPPADVALSVPQVDPAGTVDRMAVAEVTMKLAPVPVNATAVA